MRFFYHLLSFIKKTSEDKISIYAGYTTLFLFLSFFPFLMFLMALLRFTPLSADLLIEAIESVAPRQFHSMLESLIMSTYAQSSTTALSVTVIMTLWSASRGAYGLQQGLNSVYQVPARRNYLISRLMAALYTLAFTLILLLTLVLMVFGNHIQMFIESHWAIVAQFTAVILNFRTLIVVLVLMAFFWIIYCFLPNRKQHILHQLPGAAFAAAGWSIFSFAFSIYMDHSTGMSVTYGSLTTLALVILWVNICMNIVLLGGSVNAWLEQHYFIPEPKKNA